MGREGKLSKPAPQPAPSTDAVDLTAVVPREADFIALGFTIVDVDEDGHILAQTSPLVSNPPDTSEPSSLYDLIPPSDCVTLRKALSALAPNWVTLHISADGESWRTWRGYVIRNANGARLYLRDQSALEHKITDSERAEDILRFGQWTLNLETGRVEATRGFLRLLSTGGFPDTIHGAWILRRCEPKERLRIKRRLLKCAKTGDPFTLQSRVIREDGQRRVIESQVTAERNTSGKVVCLRGLSRDVTEVVIIEKELQRLDNQHKLLMNYSNDVICQVDYQGSFLFVSPAIEQMTGISIEEIVGRNISEFVHPDDIERLRNSARQANFDPGARTDQYRMQHKEGHYIWVESRVRPLMDQKGSRRLGLVAVIRDIGERKRAEEALVSAHERADIANRAKTKFLANMSHELRTPLNAIIGFSEILAREMFGPLGSTRYGEYVTLILESGRHLLDLINDLLDTAKIEAGRYELTRESLDIEDIVSAALRLVQRQAEKKNLTLDAKLTEIEGPLIADQRAVKQIIINLLSNAIKFTPSGGNVCVSVAEDPTFVLIIVSDTGIGIPAKEVGRLARPFEQVHHDLHIAQEGTGLGLALVNSLARLHGGDIEIQSSEGQGTSVIVRLPRNPPELASISA